MKNAENPVKSTSASRLRIRDLEIDVASGTLWRDGAVVDLPELSFRLLLTLAERAPGLVSKDELIEAVWGDVVVSDETLAQRARLLRQALGDDGSDSRYFTAVRGRGYRLTAPVEAIDPDPLDVRHTPDSRRGPAALLAFVAALALGALVFWQGSDNLRDIERLAVLPFKDLSRDRDYGFFADGMQEELLTRLAGIEAVDVLSRSSVERFRGTEIGIPDIAAALDADAVIEGSIRVTGDDLRITVQLIDGRSDRHLWADSFDDVLSVENIFDIQRRVAGEIAAALALERPAEPMLPTQSLDAYNRYLLGRYHTFRQTPRDLERAVRNLEAAIDIDPEFAEAYAALGLALAFQGTNYGGKRPRDVYPLAREAALKALSLDDTLADARSLYAEILTWYDWSFELAESEYRRTLELNPLNVLGYALFLSSQARHDEAVAMVERALAATPGDAYVNVNAAWRYLRAGRLDDALKTARAAAGHPDAASVFGHVLLERGNTAAAIDVFERDLAENGRNPTQIANLAHALYAADRRLEADALLEELVAMSRRQYVPAVQVAAVYAAAGRTDDTFQQLALALANRERGLIFLGVNPVFRRLAGDPRYGQLLEHVGLPVE